MTFGCVNFWLVGVGVFRCWLGFRGWVWLVGLDVGCWISSSFERFSWTYQTLHVSHVNPFGVFES